MNLLRPGEWWYIMALGILVNIDSGNCRDHFVHAPSQWDTTQRYIVMSSLIGWAHTQHDPCNWCHQAINWTNVNFNYKFSFKKTHFNAVCQKAIHFIQALNPLCVIDNAGIYLSHRGRVTHICVSNLTIFGWCLGARSQGISNHDIYYVE